MTLCSSKHLFDAASQPAEEHGKSTACLHTRQICKPWLRWERLSCRKIGAWSSNTFLRHSSSLAQPLWRCWLSKFQTLPQMLSQVMAQLAEAYMCLSRTLVQVNEGSCRDCAFIRLCRSPQISTWRTSRCFRTISDRPSPWSCWGCPRCLQGRHCFLWPYGPLMTPCLLCWNKLLNYVQSAHVHCCYRLALTVTMDVMTSSCKVGVLMSQTHAKVSSCPCMHSSFGCTQHQLFYWSLFMLSLVCDMHAWLISDLNKDAWKRRLYKSFCLTVCQRCCFTRLQW